MPGSIPWAQSHTVGSCLQEIANGAIPAASETMSDKEDVFTESHLLRRAILDLSRRKVQLIDRALPPVSTREAAPSEHAAPIDVVITPKLDRMFRSALALTPSASSNFRTSTKLHACRDNLRWCCSGLGQRGRDAGPVSPGAAEAAGAVSVTSEP